MSERTVEALCPKCLRVLDDDVEENIECIEGRCEAATADTLTDDIMHAMAHCDEERGRDGYCECGWRVRSIVAALIERAS